jgi:FAD/FMN-containing dehydrogenase/ferredoxin
MTARPPDPTFPAAPRSSFPTGSDPAPEVVADLHALLGPAAPRERSAPRRSRELAAQLLARLADLPGRSSRHTGTLAARIVTDDLLRGEADRDQNVYLGPLFTRFLSNALPDVVFQPATVPEVEAALAWARETGTPVAVRGAASSALGGCVPCDGGLTLDTARLDHVDVDAAVDVCVVGAGARMRDIHRRLAERGLALPVYSSNLGGTYAGWFVTGGVGLNAFGGRRALDIVRAADVVLPSGELVRFHADGRLDVPGSSARPGHREVPADEAEAWFRARGLDPLGLADLAGSEGILGVVVQLVLSVGRRPNIGAFLLEFRHALDAFAAAERIVAEAGGTLPRPANLRLVLGSHLRHLPAIWAEEDARWWRRRPSSLSRGDGMPWARLDGPEELRTPSASLAGPDAAPAVAPAAAATCAGRDAGAYLYVDFLGVRAGRAFAAAIADLPGRPRALGGESVRFAAERFRPQQNKRFGPGLLAAEVVLPAAVVSPYLREAYHLARRAGVELDPEVYYLGGGQGDGGGDALVIAGYLTDHRTAAFDLDLVLAPALLDLAVRRFAGRPYVLGRWQASFAADRFGPAGTERLAGLKHGLDPQDLLNRGVLLRMGLRGPLGGLVERVYRPGVTFVRRLWSTPGSAPLGRVTRAVLGVVPGPAKGRGEAAGTAAAAAPAARAIHCVNCGECNGVCPVYASSAIALPQTLTHHGELAYAGRAPGPAVAALLDLCMRCGNCEEVCQGGIPHLEVYARMAAAADAAVPYDFPRHALGLASVRGASRYRDEFLDVRPGMYLRRAPAALTGAVRFRVLRAENDAGPAATCLHCAACVPACPTNANLEFRDADARLVSTDELICIGCGACVEVCPANKLNGGQTLRVVEAPTAAALAAIADFESMGAQ